MGEFMGRDSMQLLWTCNTLTLSLVPSWENRLGKKGDQTPIISQTPSIDLNPHGHGLPPKENLCEQS
jgi:hypothetical protein